MISVDEAQYKILSSMIKVKKKEIPIISSLGLVLAEDIISGDNIPVNDNSAMDGFAVKAEDTFGAGKISPKKLKLLEEDIPAGYVPLAGLKSGYCMSIMTGAPTPGGCDCVVMKEDTKKEGDCVLVYKECRAGENIRYKAEDIKEGSIVLKKGKEIYPADIGVMASIGISRVSVYAPPLIGIITTGSELVDVKGKLTAGKVRDSNSYSLSAQVKEVGTEYIRYGIVEDDKQKLEKKILEALAECDVLLLSGGVSVGDYDYVKDILIKVGADLVFWRVNQKPGKPLAFLTYRNKFIFGLPGNPVSVMVCFEMYVRPLIRKMTGCSRLFRKTITAKAVCDIDHKKGRANFTRVIIKKKGDDYFFSTTGMQGSGILTSMALADGIALFSEDMGDIKKGSKIEVYLIKRG